MEKHHNKQFKLDTVQYYKDHTDLGVRECAENLSIRYCTLTKRLKCFRESGNIPGLSSFLCKFQKNILGRESSPFLYCKTFED